ncbi:hypothetical protein NE236_30190 [Actinoallomurus purpureus]|uniref:hypothetical protein n=1 Tax=Actinoallomurus purpureus TaxID=478114 RepID=UPI002093EA71|nr:hypothetical protein [Actinoallomurus purpureus]MCO6009249.1 hypothetical protein [Actinoallomurus purpureus]
MRRATIPIATALAISGATACWLTPLATAATSAPDPSGGIPAPGTEVRLTEKATGVDLVCAGAHHTVDLTGRAKVLIGSTHTAKGHPVVEVKTESEDLTGSSPHLGAVTVTETVPAEGAIIEHSAAHPFPATEILALQLKITLGKNPCASPTGRVAYEPLILTTRDPAKLIGTLTQFPPKGDLYQLQNPVDLIDLENPDTTVATIQKFPVKVGGL